MFLNIPLLKSIDVVSDLVQVLLMTTLAGAAMPLGGAIAMVERISPHWLEQEFRHSVMAFGGGVLISAVALVLVPDGVKALSPVWIACAFVTGAIFFWAIETWLSHSRSSMAQLIAMLSDYLPESIALGAAAAQGESSAALLAILIGLQNLPEGFNAYRELKSSSVLSRRKLICLFCAFVPLGPLAGWTGYTLLVDAPKTLAFIMLFSASGILYLTFQDLAPQAKQNSQRAPAIGAVLGFLFGVIGQQLIG